MSVRSKSRLVAALSIFACAAQAEQVVVLKDGVAALQLSSPSGAGNLSSGAAINLNLPSATMKAQATASVGQADANGGFWHRDTAELNAQLHGPLGTSVSVTGDHQLSLEYHTPAGASPQTADHLIRSENQNADVSLTVPVAGAEVVTGADRTSTLSQDTAASQSINPVVGTQDHSFYTRAKWKPLPGVSVEGGATARDTEVSWRGTTSRSSSYRSVDPNVAVAVQPWNGAAVSAKLEHVVSPYDTAAFASYSADQPFNAPPLEPDHAWQLQTRLEQGVGSAKVSATYTAARQGSATELAVGQAGTQTPASTPLVRRDTLQVGVSVPLDGAGLSDTSISSDAQWQTSRVVDPLTGGERAASGEVPRKFSLRVAHTLPDKRLSVGLTGDFTGARTAYQVNQISTTSSGGSVGAFVAFTPGPYQVDFNVTGICGSSTTDYQYRNTRQDLMPDRVLIQPNGGPMLSFSLHKPF